ncbi:MAG TPA: uridine kinase [bacterium]|nr:uridine kinase [bacterium]HQG44560.1 uridine kinase [bacterium]HQI47336.1 uridine kinase [bacterium]HQJ63389.1 uridine kinase [bacterium]
MIDPSNRFSCLIIGIAGPSGSGKSFIAEHILAALPDLRGLLLSQDDYYRDRSDLTLEKRQHINYDHPDAVEFSLLIRHLEALRAGSSIEHPLYDFSVHNRRPERRRAGPADLVIVDGLLLYTVPAMLPLFDLRLYVDTPLDICFIRRLQRDVLERGRTMESVIQQYCTTVRPMFIEHVLASRERADLVLSGEVPVEEVLPQVLQRVRALNPSLHAQRPERATPLRTWQEMLMAEHALLLRGLFLLEAAVAAKREGTIETGRIAKLLHFFLAFGDRIHNVKEENHLFPLLVENGMPQEGLIKEMLLDHEAERELIAGILARIGRAAVLTGAEQSGLAAQLEGYLFRRRAHIRQENEALYPRAAEVITTADVERIVADFAKVEERSLYPNAGRHFANLLRQLERD